MEHFLLEYMSLSEIGPLGFEHEHPLNGSILFSSSSERLVELKYLISKAAFDITGD